MTFHSFQVLNGHMWVPHFIVQIIEHFHHHRKFYCAALLWGKIERKYSMGILNLGASRTFKRRQGDLKNNMKAAEWGEVRAFSKDGQLVIEMSRVLSQRGIPNIQCGVLHPIPPTLFVANIQEILHTQPWVSGILYSTQYRWKEEWR